MAIRPPRPRTPLELVALRQRERQAAEAARSAVKVGRYWNGVEVGNEDSERMFIEVSVAELEAGFRLTAELAADFANEHLDLDDGIEIEPALPNRQQMASSMGYVGPVLARRAQFASELLEDVVTPGEAREHVANQVRGSAVRLAALGGRETVQRAVSERRVGYVRITNGDPCYFCAMLASRRAVYEEDSFDESDMRFQGPGRVKVHDSCACALIPVTRATEDQFTQIDYFEKLWRDLSGKDPKDSDSSPIVTFRRNYNKLRGSA